MSMCTGDKNSLLNVVVVGAREKGSDADDSSSGGATAYGTIMPL